MHPRERAVLQAVAFQPMELLTLLRQFGPHPSLSVIWLRANGFLTLLSEPTQVQITQSGLEALNVGTSS
jgi:hypothetical protein